MHEWDAHTGIKLLAKHRHMGKFVSETEKRPVGVLRDVSLTSELKIKHQAGRARHTTFRQLPPLPVSGSGIFSTA